MSASTPFGAFLIVAAGTGMNTVRNLQKGQDAFPTILGGLVFGTVTVAINEGTNSDIGTGLALLFLLSSFLLNGVAAIDTITEAVNSY